MSTRLSASHVSPLVAALCHQRCSTLLMPSSPRRAMASSTLTPPALATLALATAFLDTQQGCLTSVAHDTRHLFGASGEVSPDSDGLCSRCGNGQAGRHWGEEEGTLQASWTPAWLSPGLCPPVLRDLWRGDRHKSPGFQTYLYPLCAPGPQPPHHTKR